jgi:hypothetical protein
MQRVGLARMNSAEQKDGGTWIVDHTIQIGTEKALAVLRVAAAPPDGQALRHEDVEVLTVLPAKESKREHVGEAYRRLAARYGTPDNVNSDGAIELRESVSTLEKAGNTPRLFRDPKHFLANKLEALLKKDTDYEAFARRLGQSRAALQQTELAHFTPPPFKTKARFMNLEATIHWSGIVLWHLNHPDSETCQNVPRDRLEDKLGWLRDHASGVARWQAYQRVISTTLTFVNRRGLFRGVVAAYEREVTGLATCDGSRKLVGDMTGLLREYESQLTADERVPISTEILESCFALYKLLEQQHAKSGFTSLLLAFPTLLKPTTAIEVTASFAQVKVADIQRWTKQYLPQTVASRRQRMYQEAKRETKPDGKRCATPLRTAG